MGMVVFAAGDERPLMLVWAAVAGAVLAWCAVRAMEWAWWRAAAPGAGAPCPGPPRHAVPLPGGRRAAQRAAQRRGEGADHAARLPRRRAARDAAVPPGHEGARYDMFYSPLSLSRLIIAINF